MLNVSITLKFCTFFTFKKCTFEWDTNVLTFDDVYEKWSDTHYGAIKYPNTYKAAYALCYSIRNMLSHRHTSDVS